MWIWVLVLSLTLGLISSAVKTRIMITPTSHVIDQIKWASPCRLTLETVNNGSLSFTFSGLFCSSITYFLHKGLAHFWHDGQWAGVVLSFCSLTGAVTTHQRLLLVLWALSDSIFLGIGHSASTILTQLLLLKFVQSLIAQRHHGLHCFSEKTESYALKVPLTSLEAPLCEADWF